MGLPEEHEVIDGQLVKESRVVKIVGPWIARRQATPALRAKIAMLEVADPSVHRSRPSQALICEPEEFVPQRSVH